MITSCQDWPVNTNLDLALEVLQPIKVFFSIADQAYHGDDKIFKFSGKVRGK